MSEYEFTPKQLQWLEALESGKYKQGKKKLYVIKGDDTKCHCCLGVAMELFHPNAREMKLDSSYPCFSKGYGVSNKVQKLLKLRSPEGHANDSRFLSLTVMNDRGATFKEIAEHIRKNPEEYFAN